MTFFSHQALNKTVSFGSMSSYKVFYHIKHQGLLFIKDLIYNFVRRLCIFFRSFIAYFENINLQIINDESHKLCKLINKCLKVRMDKFNSFSIRISNQSLVLIFLDNDIRCSCTNQDSHVDIQFDPLLAFKF